MGAIGDLLSAVLLAGLAFLAVIRWWRQRQPIDGEIALVLALLGSVGVVATIADALHLPVALTAILLPALLVTQPYLLLRLSRHFGPVPVWQQWVGDLGLVGSLALLIVAQGSLPSSYGAVIGLYFVVVESFSGLRFYAEAMRAAGVVRQRMLMVAVGSAFLALAMVLSFLVAVAGGLTSALHLAVSLCSLAAGLSYVAGFMPPSWLRRRWQLPALYRFTSGWLTGVGPAEPELALCQAALAATGAVAVGLASPDPTAGGLRLNWHLGGGGRDSQSVPQEGSATSVITACWQSRDACQVLSAQAQAIDRQILDRLGAQSLWALPVAVDGQELVAVLVVATSRHSMFVEDDRDLLSVMARQTATAIANARLLAETRRQAEQLTALADVASAALRPIEDQEVLSAVLDVVIRVSGASAGEIWVVDEDQMVRIVERPVAVSRLRWPIGEGLVGEVLRTNQPAFSADVTSDPRFLRPKEEALAQGYRCILAVPLVVLDRPVGVLAVMYPTDPSLAADDIGRFEAIAQHVALTLRNLELYRAATRRSEQLAALHASALALSAEQPLADLLQQIAEASCKLLNARYAALWLFDDGGHPVQFVTAGVMDETSALIGSPPKGQGLLSPAATSSGPVLIDNIGNDPRSVGFPPHHPVMTTFLGVPIRHESRRFGTLYLTDRQDGLPFDSQDEHFAEALASQAALAIRNAELLAQATEAAAELRRVNADLVQANEAKSIFLASMSHELRTPLNAVLGFTEIMLDDPDLAAETRQHYLDTVHQSGTHLLGLINDILDLSKVEAGRMELQLETFQIGEVIRDALATVAPLAARNEVTLSLEADDPPPLEGDRGKVKQILYNLLSNAIKFTPPGGQIALSCTVSPGEVLLAVRDDGVGIAAEDQERIFEEFQQVKGTANRGGTGLGLSLARRFAELHGGRLWVSSELGAGSTFWLSLPTERSKPSAPGTTVAPSRTRSATADPSAPLILVVEDDLPAAHLLTNLLNRQGFQVTSVRTGEEALAQAAALGPAAITLDVILPGLSGWEALRALKQSPQTSHIPVVVVTIADDPQMALALGAADFLLKPVSRATLTEALDRLGLGPPASGRPRSALTIDDDPASRLAIAAALESLGLEVRQAEGGREGLAAARLAVPDVVVLDLAMPDMDGFQVLEALRRDKRLAQVPVLIVTARDISAAEYETLTNSAAAVFQKGAYSRQDLVSWLAQALQGEVLRSG